MFTYLFIMGAASRPHYADTLLDGQESGLLGSAARGCDDRKASEQIR
jgi:hypothetical protein